MVLRDDSVLVALTPRATATLFLAPPLVGLDDAADDGVTDYVVCFKTSESNSLDAREQAHRLQQATAVFWSQVNL